MINNLDRLLVKNLIVHEVPVRRAGSEQQPIFSEVESNLDTENKNFFEKNPCKLTNIRF